MVTAEFQETRRSMQGLLNLSLEPAYITAATFYYSEKITKPAQIQGEKKYPVS